nr:aminotransferase class I/II-fold pyridoxal phosphate-dependent enzyme [Rhodoferax sp.]
MALTVFISPASAAPSPPRIHGGPDALGVPHFDFSTNSNACGPCPVALTAVQQADATRYPDASYVALRAQLAAFHGVDGQRVLLAGSASEFIFRITAWVVQRGGRDGGHFGKGNVCLPPHSYGDYAQAAQAWGWGVSAQLDDAQLVWLCEPSSPLGAPHASWPRWVEGSAGILSVPVVLDRAYEPLRLSGAPRLTAAQLEKVWQLWTPNKALGLTGVRAAYVIAPLGADAAVAALECLCPSWPLGAHGVALLQSWVQPEVQGWLAESLHSLRRWKAMQIDMLNGLGWTCLPSDANFFCARPGLGCDLKQLRAAGIKLRDTASFGLPGHVRVSVQPPAAQDALKMAWQAIAISPAPPPPPGPPSDKGMT